MWVDGLKDKLVHLMQGLMQSEFHQLEILSRSLNVNCCFKWVPEGPSRGRRAGEGFPSVVEGLSGIHKVLGSITSKRWGVD